MKFQKLLVIAAISCLLVGATGAAMAGPELPTDSDCPLGIILNAAVNNLTVVNGDCLVRDSIIAGNVIVSNGPDDVFVMREVVIGGSLEVRGGSVVITGAILSSANFKVVGAVDTVVSDTLIESGNMIFRRNERLFIYRNVVNNGSIRCKNNIDLNGQRQELATQNIVPSGVVTCFGQ